MKSQDFLAEATPGMDEINVPKKLAAAIAKEYDIEHTKVPEPLEKAPSKAEAQNNLVIFVKDDGTAYAVHQRRDSYWHFWTYKNGEIKYADKKNIGDVKKLIGATKKNGHWYAVEGGWDGIRYRDEKPASDVDSVRKREEVGQGEVWYDYMDRVFLPKIQDKLNGYADAIYAGLREIPRDYDKYGDHNPGGIRRNIVGNRDRQSAREAALMAAEAIESIAEHGFTKKTVAKFIETYGTLHHGYGSIPDNEAEFQKLMQEEPAARAKFAKTLLQMGKKEYEKVQELKMSILKDKMQPKESEDLNDIKILGGIK